MRKGNVVNMGQSATSALRTTSPKARERNDHKGPLFKSLCVAIVDIRLLTREALVYLLQDLALGWRIKSFSYTHEMTKCDDYNGSSRPNVIILACSGRLDNSCTVEKDIATVKESLPCVPVAILSDCDDIGLVAACLRLGASGVITTSLAPRIMIGAIALVAVGGTYIPSGAIVGLMEQHQRHSEDHRLDLVPHLYGVPVDPQITLTPRQWDVLRLLGQGLPNKTIAHMLQLQECSVKAHVRQLMQKLGAHNRTQIACHAVRILGKEGLDKSM